MVDKLDQALANEEAISSQLDTLKTEEDALLAAIATTPANDPRMDTLLTDQAAVQAKIVDLLKNAVVTPPVA